MDFRIVYTRPALVDLQQILAWSWENHSGTTERFAMALLNHVGLLRSFPRVGQPVKGFPGVRRIPQFASPYLLSNLAGTESRGNPALLARVAPAAPVIAGQSVTRVSRTSGSG